tara:strand:- start:770 stop:1420 length:651 start_codon:yes stop_codon:yes gene_type:complete
MNIVTNNQIINHSIKITVNARDLHEFLGVKTQFSHWITKRISKFDFQKDNDYIVIVKKDQNSTGGRPEADYHLTSSMAKELSMLENNEKGKEVRKYFIKLEENQSGVARVHSPEDQKAIDEKNKEDFYNKISTLTQDDMLYTVSDIVPDTPCKTARELNILLAKLGIQQRVNGVWYLVPELQGYGYEKIKSVTRYGEKEYYMVFTSLGLDMILNKI